eukprot:Skav228458  [mRNA]  locus=scaffold1058:238869:253305:- [translate_table: standard]
MLTANKKTSFVEIFEEFSAREASGLEDVLPSNSIHEVKVATSWLLTIAVKAREPAIIIGELKFTWGHLVIVSLGGTAVTWKWQPEPAQFAGVFVLLSTLYMLLAADADQRKIKSASIRHILMSTPQDIAAAKQRLDNGDPWNAGSVAFNPNVPIGEVVGPVHYNLFAGSVLAVGTEEQVKHLDEIQQKAGSQQSGVEMVPVWCTQIVPVCGGVVNTIAEWDVPLAFQALFASISWGKLEDMGRKTVGNDLDNAWIAFHGARVPRHALLSRYGEVQPGNGGSYVSKVKGLSNMAMIGQRLFSGRVAVAWAAITFTRKLFEMTREYSDRKKCQYGRAEETLQKLEAFVTRCEKQLSLQKDEIPPLALQEAIASAKILASALWNAGAFGSFEKRSAGLRGAICCSMVTGAVEQHAVIWEGLSGCEVGMI